MYSLKEGWEAMFGTLPMEGWDGRIYSTDTDAGRTFRTNETQGFLAAYTFTLVTEGWLSIVYNGRELTLHPNDLYIYSPGLPVTVVAASENYRAICLLADEHTTIDTPAVHDLLHIAYMPVVQLHEPVLKLPAEQSAQIAARMREIAACLHSTHVYRKEKLRMLYAIFLLDLQNVQSTLATSRRASKRMETFFLDFVRLLPQHFARHHNIAFYASALSISPVYLSRVVRQVAGGTVVGYINRMLVMEASFLLRTSKLSISQIAERLHFADTPTFSKFFARHKGLSPREYRERG